MKLVPLALPGAFRIELEPHADERGFFARSFCRRELAAAGIDFTIEQTSLSWNPRRGTLRGLHWQAAPHGEAKIVRCVRGRIHDVAVDVRPRSPGFRRHLAVELDGERREALLLPAGVAHGFLTLTDDCEVHYAMDGAFVADAARGARWDDAAFAIEWPAPVEVISERDAAWPPFGGEGGRP